jgi:hypothetical protein
LPSCQACLSPVLPCCAMPCRPPQRASGKPWHERRKRRAQSSACRKPAQHRVRSLQLDGRVVVLATKRSAAETAQLRRKPLTASDRTAREALLTPPERGDSGRSPTGCDAMAGTFPLRSPSSHVKKSVVGVHRPARQPPHVAELRQRRREWPQRPTAVSLERDEAHTRGR